MKIEVIEDAPVAAKPAVSAESTPKVISRPKKAAVAAYVDTFVPHSSGDPTEWIFKGETYYRSVKNALYNIDGEFQGVFDKTTATINADVANPDDE